MSVGVRLDIWDHHSHLESSRQRWEEICGFPWGSALWPLSAISTLQAIAYNESLLKERGWEEAGKRIKLDESVRDFWGKKHHPFVSGCSLIWSRSWNEAGSVWWDQGGVVPISLTAPRLSHWHFKLAFYLHIRPFRKKALSLSDPPWVR